MASTAMIESGPSPEKSRRDVIIRKPVKSSTKQVEQTSAIVEACKSDDSPRDDTPVSTWGNSFKVSGGTQYNNTGNGNQFLGSQFHGEVNFVGGNGDSGKSMRSCLTTSILGSDLPTKETIPEREGRPRS
jgi:hypothetical protein